MTNKLSRIAPLVALLALAPLGCSGCSPAVSQAVSQEAGPILQVGCSALQGIPGADGTTIATVCKDVVPIVTPIIQSIIAALGDKAKLPAGTVLEFVPLKNKDGSIAGSVRSDIAAAVQAKWSEAH